MLSPTHVEVLVKRARGLKIKGKNGTNDAYVTVEVGKERWQTGVQEKCESPTWNEKNLMWIPDNNAEILVKVIHKNFMGGEDFLGQLCLDLRDFDVYSKPKTGWYPLTCKPGKNKSGYRGEIELSIGFSVNNHPHHEEKSERRMSQVMTYSETQISARNCSWSDNDNDDPGVVSEIEDEMLEEIGPVTPVLTPTHSTEDILDMFDKTGSLSSTSKFTTSHAFNLETDSLNKSGIQITLSESTKHHTSSSEEDLNNDNSTYVHRQAEVSHKQSSILPEAKKNYNKDTDEGYCSRKVSVESSASTISSDSGLASSPDSAPEDERVVIGQEKNPKIQTSSDLPDDVKERFRGQSREDLIEMVCFLQRTVESQGKKVADLEDYIDGMVLRVMEKAPVILDTNLKYYCSLYKQR